ncbi:MAG: ferredoxin [Solirubrobacterales bacterium]
MSYLPTIDPNACSAHGDCVEIAPEVFRLGDVAEVIGQGSAEVVLEAAEACPALAISVVDSESGQSIFP